MWTWDQSAGQPRRNGEVIADGDEEAGMGPVGRQLVRRAATMTWRP